MSNEFVTNCVVNSRDQFRAQHQGAGRVWIAFNEWEDGRNTQVFFVLSENDAVLLARYLIDPSIRQNGIRFGCADRRGDKFWVEQSFAGVAFEGWMGEGEKVSVILSVDGTKELAEFITGEKAKKLEHVELKCKIADSDRLYVDEGAESVRLRTTGGSMVYLEEADLLTLLGTLGRAYNSIYEPNDVTIGVLKTVEREVETVSVEVVEETEVTILA